MKKFGMFLAVISLVAAVATACGGSSKTTESTSAAASESSTAAVSGPTITIADMAYGEPLTVAPGTQINLVNKDTVEHSVTSDTAGAFSKDVDGGENGTMTAPSQPGTYAFHCKYHPNMHGTLTVK
jgi:plastocyanin